MRLPTPNRDQSNSSVEDVYFRDIENSRKELGEIFYSIHYTYNYKFSSLEFRFNNGKKQRTILYKRDT